MEFGVGRGTIPLHFQGFNISRDESRERFEEALENFNGTILAVVHDRSFIEHFATDVWQARDGKIYK